MRRQIQALTVTLTLLNLAFMPLVFAESAEALFDKGQTAYTNGQLPDAIRYFEQAVQADENFADAYFNLGAIYFNQKRFPDALEAFNKVLQRDPSDHSARYELAKVYEKMNRVPEAIATFELIGPASSRYSKAQENIARLRNPQPQTSVAQAVSQPSKPVMAKPVVSSKKQETVSLLSTNTETSEPSQTMMAKPVASSIFSAKESQEIANLNKESIARTGTPNAKPKVEEFVAGFSGPTGVAVDNAGVLYVANFSKNSIYRVTPSGNKVLLASGSGINGPVGLTVDTQSGMLYIANHLDNTVSKITPQGKVSVIATGLKKPYNIFLDSTNQTLYVSQQESNSVAKIKLN